MPATRARPRAANRRPTYSSVSGSRSCAHNLMTRRARGDVGGGNFAVARAAILALAHRGHRHLGLAFLHLEDLGMARRTPHPLRVRLVWKGHPVLFLPRR